jgi:hypothetical protein
MSQHIHLCLVSERPLANLIPLLQYRPDYVALGVSPGMKRQGENFHKLLVGLGYTESCLLTYPVPDHGIESLRDAALDIRVKLEDCFPEGQITYNATGGNKLMSLAFAEVFMQGQDHRVIYTDTAQDCIETLHPKPATEAMQSVLGIEVYLRAHGKRLGRTASDNPVWCEKANARKALSKWLAHNADRLDGFYGALNAMALKALEPNPPRGQPPRLLQAKQFITSKPWGPWVEALEKITEAGCARWDAAQPQDLYFDDAEGAAYLGGRWLEEYVWHILADAKVEEVKAGAEFTDTARPSSDVRNELDGVAAHRNRLLLVECKTGSLEQKAEVVYKLDSIAQDMGLFQQRLLVSARPLDEATRARTQSKGITIIEAGGLRQLREVVKNWMENR